MRKLRFSTALLSIALIAFCTVILMLLVPAYQASQRALREEIGITHQKNQKVLQQFFDKYLQVATHHAEETSQRKLLVTALKDNNLSAAKSFLNAQLSGQAGESIHAFSLHKGSESSSSLQVFNTALLGMRIDLTELLESVETDRSWSIKSIKTNEDSSHLLHISFPVINDHLGEVIGTLNAFILLNDNFQIISEIQSLTGADDVGLFAKNKLISGLSLTPEALPLLENLDPSQPFNINESGKTIHQYTLSLGQNEYFHTKVTLPNTSLIVLENAYTKDLGTALLGIIIVIVMTVLLISYLTRSSLTKLVHYADRMATHKEIEPFSPGPFSEFNGLGHTIEHMVHKISEHESQLNGIIENTPNILFIKGTDLRYKMVSANYSKLAKIDSSEIIGKTDEEIFSKEHAEIVKTSDIYVIEQRTPQQIEYSFGGDSDKRHYLSTKFPLADDNGLIYAVGGIVTDITDLKKAQSHNHLAEQIFDQAGEAILVVNTNFEVVSSNSAFKTLSGLLVDEISLFSKKLFIDNPIIQLRLQQHKRWQGETELRHKNGRSIPIWLSASSITTDDEQTQFLIIFSDISALKSAETQLERLSNYDNLTNLPNRSLFFDRLSSAIERSSRANNKTALFFINIDRFKNINDTYGHAVGDQLLIETANRITECIRPDDTVSRLGGDEFGVIIQGVQSLEVINYISHQIQDALRSPFQLENFTSSSPASIGISLYPDDSSDAKTLLTHADTAMYQVKDKGRNGIQFYDQALNLQAEEQVKLEEDLRSAFRNDELFLAYQPRFNIDGNAILSAEALARWNHPQQGLIPPSIFIELAEQTGLIVELGRHILQTACLAAKAWNVNPEHPIPVSVNLSARQIYDPDLIDDISKALSISQLPPELLELEITETLAIEDLDKVIDKLNRIKEMGIRMSVDDFGTGYSSLIYLKKLPVSTVKIDRSFIMDVPGNQDDEHIVSAIISMSHSLQLTVVAEGVETQEQLEFLKAHQCDEIQGFLLGKPGPSSILLEHAQSYL